MKPIYKKLNTLIFTLFMLLVCSYSGISQQGLTLEQALNVAELNSPTMKKTRLNLIRSQENLNAQNASLKSNFSLTLNPIGYTKVREFSARDAQWYSRTATESYGNFTVSQPIVMTDARISLTNRFGYKDSYSEFANPSTTKGFSNNLSLNLDQPLFTYNRTKLQLKELQLSLENSQLSYAIQLLALERQVAQAFYYVYQQQQSLDIANQAYQNMQKSYEVSKNKVDAGISAREEMFQAELNLATSS
jgi:outer membrane protein